MVKVKNVFKIFKFNGYVLSFEELITNVKEFLDNNYSILIPKEMVKDNQVFLQNLYKVGLEDNSEIIVS